jgi:hypothetical protein
VVYDPEPWAATPEAEARNPVAYARMFAILAHRHGWLAMMAPSCRLLRRMPGSRKVSVFDACGPLIQAAMAPYADILDLQAQSMEGDTNAYASHVIDWAARARGANPRIKVIAQLSTARSHNAPPDVLLRDALSVASYVDGFWIDIESRRPDSVADAVTFLQRVRATGR